MKVSSESRSLYGIHGETSIGTEGYTKSTLSIDGKIKTKVPTAVQSESLSDSTDDPLSSRCGNLKELQTH